MFLIHVVGFYPAVGGRKNTNRGVDCVSVGVA